MTRSVPQLFARFCLGSTVLVAVLGLIHAATGPVSAAAPDRPTARVDAEVVSAMTRAGKATYWVVLREQADLSGAAQRDHKSRGRFVVDTLQKTAKRSQMGLKDLFHARGADSTEFWAANVVKVTSDEATLEAVAALPEVAEVQADRVFRIPEPMAGSLESTIQGVEWNVANIRAPDVWSAFGTRGEGVVVGSIDTGVQFDHPTLVNQYRGNRGGGWFDHDYNWYDPSSVCGSPSLVPCDNINHGTHTLGTIVGDDGGANRIGVAPGARWITAKGCETSSCSLTALVAAGQWMLAPTDLNGENPRADLRPDIVSNSWSSAAGDTFYRQIVQSWVAAGIFPVFANGNNGPACGTVGSPADYLESYGVGAYDAANTVASFSSRGVSAFGVIKPDISAPGVNVRSAIPGGGYAAYNGTSMATPHVAGTAALIWSIAPVLLNDVAGTRAVLDQTALDTTDRSCGGNSADNNVYGQGRLDAYAAVEQAPRAAVGELQGTVIDAATGKGLPGMLVELANSSWATVTDASGFYAFTLPVGSYDLTASGFGYGSVDVDGIGVAEGVTIVRDVALTGALAHRLSGHVRNQVGQPVANATVTILGTPIAAATTDETGAFLFASVPTGDYAVRADVGRCNDPQTQAIVLDAEDAETVLDFVLPARTDAFGYGCQIVAPVWEDTTTVLPLTGDDQWTSVILPFVFPFYGASYGTVYVDTNGSLNFLAGRTLLNNVGIPAMGPFDAAVYPLWDDLYVDASSSIWTREVGAPPNRRVAIEWRNVAFFADTTRTERLDFEVVLHEDGTIVTQYRKLSPGSARVQGAYATVGLENADGTDGFRYGFNEPVISEGLAIRYSVVPVPGAQAQVSPSSLAFSMSVGHSETKTLTLANTGDLELTWQLVEKGGDVGWLLATPTSGAVAPGENIPIDVTANATGRAGGTYGATLLLESNSGRQPSISIPVSLTVTQYSQAVNAGSNTAYTDTAGVQWAADQKYVTGKWGYTNAKASTATTTNGIAGTTDDVLFQSQRLTPTEYRFDGLPAGTYQLTLHFAEFKALKVGQRVFNVVVDGGTVLLAHDIMRDAGRYAADTHSVVEVAVSDGQLNLAFVPAGTKEPPAVNAIRVLQVR